jgi:hypothetical protein
MFCLLHFNKKYVGLLVKIYLTIIFVCVYSILFSQTLTEKDIKEIAEETNNQMQGLNIANGVTIRGCYSYGRTIFFQYDVIEEWIPSKNMKKDIIDNFKKDGGAKFYFNNDVDAVFHYFTNGKLREKVSINSQEFSNLNFDLGDYISIKGHPKAKNVNLKLQQPEGWQILEGDRPNVVKKFVNNTNMYLILIKDNLTFVSRNEANELWADEEIINEFIMEFTATFDHLEILKHRIVTIDRYPTLEYTFKCYVERTGFGYNMIMKTWLILYEDKFIILQCSCKDEMEFKKLEGFYNMITNSVIFPEQYN